MWHVVVEWSIVHRTQAPVPKSSRCGFESRSLTVSMTSLHSWCISTYAYNLSSIDRRSCEIIMKEKTPLSHGVVCFQKLDFENSNSQSEVSKSNPLKITSFLKTTLLQRELFLTMFYTINLSPLLVTKKGFMLVIILSNYQ